MGGTISILVEKLLRKYCYYGCEWVYFIHTPRNKLEKNKWNCFVNQVHGLLEVVQELNVVKLYGQTKVWMLEKGIITIYT